MVQGVNAGADRGYCKCYMESARKKRPGAGAKISGTLPGNEIAINALICAGYALSIGLAAAYAAPEAVEPRWSERHPRIFAKVIKLRKFCNTISPMVNVSANVITAAAAVAKR